MGMFIVFQIGEVGLASWGGEMRGSQAHAQVDFRGCCPRFLQMTSDGDLSIFKRWKTPLAVRYHDLSFHFIRNAVSGLLCDP